MCKMNPLVSVIVPIYNVEQFLCRCIDSILAQTMTDFELILVDDESKDRCASICDAYAAKDGRVRVIHKKNGGVSAARNTGLDAAVGRYIAFCDGDDHWVPDMLETLTAAMEAEGADIVTCGYMQVDESGALLETVKRFPGTDRLADQAEVVSYLIQGILGGKYGWEIWTRLFQRDLIEANHIRFCTSCGNYAEDMAFVLQYCLHIRAACSLEYCGYYYLVRDGSMMRSSAQVVKLDQTNEASACVGAAFAQTIRDRQLRQLYPVIHFLMMHNEYLKLIRSGRYHTLPQELEKIKNQKWYREQTAKIRRCFRDLKVLYGKRTAQRILLISHFCTHRSWRRFRYESAIAYRWLIEGE